MNILKSIITMCLLLGCTHVVSAQNINFSGHWAINQSQSDFAGQEPAVMYNELIVIQTKDSLQVEGIRFAGGSTKLSYPLNGQSVINKLPDGRKMAATISWSSVHSSLSRNSIYYLSDQPDKEDYQSKEVWTLSGGGKQLTLNRTFVRTSGNVIINAVYDKQ